MKSRWLSGVHSHRSNAVRLALCHHFSQFHNFVSLFHKYRRPKREYQKHCEKGKFVVGNMQFPLLFFPNNTQSTQAWSKTTCKTDREKRVKRRQHRVLRARSHCVWPKRTLFFTWIRFDHVFENVASTRKTASVSFRILWAWAAWNYEELAFSKALYCLSGAFQGALLSYRAVNVDDLTFEKASSQIHFVFAEKRAHFWTRVWLRLRLRESPPPPLGDPRFRLSAFAVWVRVYMKVRPRTPKYKFA